MNILIAIFGEDEHISWWQMGLRTIVLFFITLLMIRIAGRRTFGRKTAFDNIVGIMLGAILSRAVVGATPFVSVVVSGLVLVVIHRWLAKLVSHHDKICKLVQGSPRCLYSNGRFEQENLDKSLISKHDLLESIRTKANTESFDGIESIYMESNGEISVVKKSNSLPA